MENVIRVQFPDHFTHPCYLPTESQMKAELRGDPAPRKKRDKCGSLYWHPRAGLWKASNVSFNPETKIALSYDWWIFVKRIKGKLVFNSFRYSSSTAKHQWKMREFLNEQGIKIDLEIDAPRGLQDLESAISCCQVEIDTLKELVMRRGSRKSKNAERLLEIDRLKEKQKTIRKLMGVK